MKSRMESKMSSLVVIGVDIGKEVFHHYLVGFAATGRLPSAGGSGDWVSKMPSRSCRRASSPWMPAVAQI
jgi:hypothetical protein